MRLEELGWNSFFQQRFESFRLQGFEPARVSRAHKSDLFTLLGERGESAGQLSGRFLHQAQARSDMPATGDWVAVQPLERENKAVIHAALPRQSWFRRKSAGGFTREGADGRAEEVNARTEAQVIAANVDVVFLVAALNRDFNPGRIERYLLLVRSSGAKPVIVLNKADLPKNPGEFVEIARAIAGPDVPIHPTVASTGEGVEHLRRHLGQGKTGALLGSSGVGKSSLINRLLGGEELLPTGPARETDNKGRHTTTWRELVPVPGGGLLIDTPGLREVKLWADEETLAQSFPEVEALAEQCEREDCQHFVDPGCALSEAADSGLLSPERYERYQAFRREAQALARRKASMAKLQEKRARQKLRAQGASALAKKKRGRSRPSTRDWLANADD